MALQFWEYARLDAAQEACSQAARGERVYALDHHDIQKQRITKRFFLAAWPDLFRQVVLMENTYYRNVYEIVSGRRLAAMYMDIDLKIAAAACTSLQPEFGHVAHLLG